MEQSANRQWKPTGFLSERQTERKRSFPILLILSEYISTVALANQISPEFNISADQTAKYAKLILYKFPFRVFGIFRGFPLHTFHESALLSAIRC
jgi:hypothetical protein